MRLRRRRLSVLIVCMCAASVAAACGGTTTSPTQENLVVSPQNTSLVPGVDRISIALLDPQQNPVEASGVSVDVLDANGRSLETRALENIGPQYGGIPVYVGAARFPDVGQYEFVVHGTRDGQPLLGHAYVTVRLTTSEVQVGAHVPMLAQPILGDPGVMLKQIDSGVPPDNWHTATIADGVRQHRPMVLFFGDPAYCPSKTCGPTRDILLQLCTRFCSSLLFEHIETYYPAGPPGPQAHINPAFTAFGLQSDPWIYFVTANGVVSDRYEGPVTLDQLVQSAQGTLAGRVPAVALH